MEPSKKVREATIFSFFECSDHYAGGGVLVLIGRTLRRKRLILELYFVFCRSKIKAITKPEGGLPDTGIGLSCQPLLRKECFSFCDCSNLYKIIFIVIRPLKQGKVWGKTIIKKKYPYYHLTLWY